MINTKALFEQKAFGRNLLPRYTSSRVTQVFSARGKSKATRLDTHNTHANANAREKHTCRAAKNME